MFDHLDARSPVPLYEQIAQRLRVGIAAGELAAGEGLPSVRVLAGQLRINPATVVQAYRSLETEGLIEMRQGMGTFVSEIGATRRRATRSAEARRLVRELMAEIGRLGIGISELRAAIEAELDGRGK
ncbi:MAG: GntR family transcriptional regulator [Longimicrobiales bacterium]